MCDSFRAAPLRACRAPAVETRLIGNKAIRRFAACACGPAADAGQAAADSVPFDISAPRPPPGDAGPDRHDYDPRPCARPPGPTGGGPVNPDLEAPPLSRHRRAGGPIDPATGQPNHRAEVVGPLVVVAAERGVARHHRGRDRPCHSTSTRRPSRWCSGSGSSSSSTNSATSSPPSGATSTSRRSASGSARPCRSARTSGARPLT